MPLIEVIRTDDDYEISDKTARENSQQALDDVNEINKNINITNIEFMKEVL